MPHPELHSGNIKNKPDTGLAFRKLNLERSLEESWVLFFFPPEKDSSLYQLIFWGEYLLWVELCPPQKKKCWHSITQ